jgi:hypothetical protein
MTAYLLSVQGSVSGRFFHRSLPFAPFFSVTRSQRDLHQQVCAHAGRTTKKEG